MFGLRARVWNDVLDWTQGLVQDMDMDLDLGGFGGGRREGHWGKLWKSDLIIFVILSHGPGSIQLVAASVLCRQFKSSLLLSSESVLVMGTIPCAQLLR
jgi:hypothetical protein